MSKIYRLPCHNYYGDGLYFITTTISDWQKLFGEIRNKKMFLSEIGEIVLENLLMIPQKFPGFILIEWMIMPHHVHMILQIKDFYKFPLRPQGGCAINRAANSDGKIVIPNNVMQKRYPTTGYVMRFFKARTTHMIREKFPQIDFNWASRYYDIILRDEKALETVRGYIRTNPSRWREDEVQTEIDFAVK